MISIINQYESCDGSIKYVFSNKKNNLFEAIYFSYPDRHQKITEPYNICISSQAGCAMGCKFCATAQGGFFENLTSSELMEQINLIKADIEKHGTEQKGNPFRIILMGMGEPLMNYNNIITFIHEANQNFEQLNRILISTVGITPKIIELSQLPQNLKLNLHLSVHSPYESERASFMPVTKKYSLKSAIDACKLFSYKTNTDIKASYLLLNNINDSKKHAKALASILDKDIFIIQILLYNETPDMPYLRPSLKTAEIFKNTLLNLGFRAYIRTSSGRDISGGCGQLIQKIKHKKNSC